MDTETRELIDALTKELERCESTITALYALALDAGLIHRDDIHANRVRDRKAAILELILRVRGDGVNPPIVPFLCSIIRRFKSLVKPTYSTRVLLVRM